MFFFEKKNQKTFVSSLLPNIGQGLALFVGLLVTGADNRILRLAGCSLRCAIRFQLGVAYNLANGFLHSTLDLMADSFQAIRIQFSWSFTRPGTCGANARLGQTLAHTAAPETTHAAPLGNFRSSRAAPGRSMQGH
jgi:hypothetical protein